MAAPAYVDFTKLQVDKGGNIFNTIDNAAHFVDGEDNRNWTRETF